MCIRLFSQVNGECMAAQSSSVLNESLSKDCPAGPESL